ncbi:MAG: hypothetical protein EHJ95_04065 [Methanobacteriota archaeon]|nr:MAG: hypothetical protein EHJ95_04065 [Euryarchaeota archaeon]
MAVESTIKVSTEVKGRLDRLKQHPRETYNEVIDRLARECAEEDDLLTEEDLEDIEEAVADIRAGRTYTTDQLKKELDLDR